ncbi:MAG: HNH endonuclease domain-containing protein [Kiritimatiellia bacterium]
MTTRKHKQFFKPIGVFCAFLLQFSVCAGWNEACSAVRDKMERAAQESGKWILVHPKEPAAVPVAGHASQEPDLSAKANRTAKYVYVTSHSPEGAYRPFTRAQKADILRQNRARNGGRLTSDYSGKALEEPRRYAKGHLPSPNEAQVDHVIPRSRGGWNSADNAQVLSRDENLRKSDRRNWRHE